MPNLKGGKKYKSGKKNAEIKIELHDINEADGQMVGRVIKKLGDRNVILYCNDNKERLAHMRGVLKKKKIWIDIGDIVLFSNRDELTSNDQERGDILAKYDRDIHTQLKRMPGINPILFQTIENWDTRTRDQAMRGIRVVEDDCGVDFEDDSESEEETDEMKLEGERVTQEKKKQVEETKRAAARETKRVVVNEDDSIDIDAI